MASAHRRLLFCAAATVVLAGGSTLALADPGPAPTPSNPVLVDLPGHTQAKQDGVKFSTRDDAKVASFTLTYGAGAESGWHAHPGIVIAVVESGSVIRQVGREEQTSVRETPSLRLSRIM